MEEDVNERIADLLYEFADRLEALDVEYKPRAYRDAAESVLEADPEDLEEPTSIPNVGDAIGSKIEEYLESGEIEELNELRREIPIDIGGITAVEGVGPKTAAKLYNALGIRGLDDLEEAARAKRIRNVEGFGEKTEQKILEGIEFARQKHKRMTLGEALPLARDVVERLEMIDEVENASAAGSVRRRKETVGDLDIVVVSSNHSTTADRVVEWGVEVIQKGESKTSVRYNDTQIDLHLVDRDEYGSALQYFTGSKQHNVEVRDIALNQGLKLNEYGLWRENECVAGESEEGIYRELGLSYVPPELRENRGEIEAAKESELPSLVSLRDIRGDLHTHTDRTDGDVSLEEMVRGAEEQGYEYIAVTDHTKELGMVGGLNEEELRTQASEIDRINEESSVTVFSGAETNVLRDGTLDINRGTLEELDIVIGSIHTAMNMNKEEATERLTTALKQNIDVLGHPSGRLLNQREKYPYDYERVLRTAEQEGVALEVNANPKRLDIWDTQVRRAVEENVKIVINTDAHHPDSFDYMEYGVSTARRGWAERNDVLNTLPTEDFQEWLS